MRKLRERGTSMNFVMMWSLSRGLNPSAADRSGTFRANGRAWQCTIRVRLSVFKTEGANYPDFNLHDYVRWAGCAQTTPWNRSVRID
jgi:hypothetical protein